MHKRNFKPIIGNRCGGLLSRGKNGVIFSAIVRREGTLAARKHEEQHAVDLFMHEAKAWPGPFTVPLGRRLLNQAKVGPHFIEAWLRERFFSKLGIGFGESSPASLKRSLEVYFRAEREANLNRAKSEIFAYLKEFRVRPSFTRPDSDVISILEESEDQSGLYEFSSWLTNMDNGMPEFDKIYHEMATRILDKGYKKIVRKAFEAMQDLMHEQGFSLSQAIALLTPEPLIRWPRVAEKESRKNKA
jgi:hypothetical protein